MLRDIILEQSKSCLSIKKKESNFFTVIQDNYFQINKMAIAAYNLFSCIQPLKTFNHI